MWLKKVVVMSVVMLSLSFSSFVFGQSEWKERKSAWENLLEDKDRISLMTGGDLNGDYIDDVVVIYRSGPNQGIVVLISDRNEYKHYRFQGNRLDLIFNTELAQASNIRIRDGKIDVLCPFNGKKLLAGIASNEDATITLRFSENSLKLTDIAFNAALAQQEANAQVWFDAATGQVYMEYLAQQETVGGKRNYYFRYYYRLVAYPLDRVSIDGEDDEWVLFSYPAYLKNSPIGNPITYGFEKWKSDFDVSGRIYVGYDQNMLYFLVDIYDDVFNQTFSGDKILRGDHVELWFANESGYKVQLGISPGNFTDVLPEARLWYQGSRAVSGRGLEQVTIAAKRSEHGYGMEFAIPFNLLPEGYKKIGTTAFSIVISDSDQQSKQEKLLSSSSLAWGESYSLGELIFQK